MPCPGEGTYIRCVTSPNEDSHSFHGVSNYCLWAGLCSAVVFSPNAHEPYRVTASRDKHQVLDVLAACSRDAMSARREHVALVAEQKAGKGEDKDDDDDTGKDKGKGREKGKAVSLPHPGDEGSLRRWEELLRSVDVNGGRWRSDVVGGGSAGGSSEHVSGGH